MYKTNVYSKNIALEWETHSVGLTNKCDGFQYHKVHITNYKSTYKNKDTWDRSHIQYWDIPGSISKECYYKYHNMRFCRDSNPDKHIYGMYNQFE